MDGTFRKTSVEFLFLSRFDLPKIEKKNTCNQKYHEMNIKVSWVKIDTKVGLLLTNK